MLFCPGTSPNSRNTETTVLPTTAMHANQRGTAFSPLSPDEPAPAASANCNSGSFPSAAAAMVGAAEAAVLKRAVFAGGAGADAAIAGAAGCGAANRPGARGVTGGEVATAAADAMSGGSSQ